MANNETVMEEDQKMSTDSATNQDSKQNPPIDLREISIILDGWSRTCDTVLNTLNEQIFKIIQNNGTTNKSNCKIK